MADLSWSAWGLGVFLVVMIPMVSSDPNVVGPVFGLCIVSFFLGVTADV